MYLGAHLRSLKFFIVLSFLLHIGIFSGRYQACADIRRSESSVEELRCLGSWKEGSTHYFLGEKDGFLANSTVTTSKLILFLAESLLACQISTPKALVAFLMFVFVVGVSFAQMHFRSERCTHSFATWRLPLLGKLDILHTEFWELNWERGRHIWWNIFNITVGIC